MAFDSVHKQIKTDKNVILSELQHSLETTTVLGIFLKDTNELVTTAVKSLTEEPSGDWLVTLMCQDLHGYDIENPNILLSNIERVIPFNINFDDPMYTRERRKEKFKV
ncbi:MAG TPA: hypothetical protein VD927_00895 [Chryseosolibacter sp.]|nr:hypothetical protein [Chryseosolibacter sp.]